MLWMDERHTYTDSNNYVASTLFNIAAPDWSIQKSSLVFDTNHSTEKSHAFLGGVKSLSFNVVLYMNNKYTLQSVFQQFWMADYRQGNFLSYSFFSKTFCIFVACPTYPVWLAGKDRQTWLTIAICSSSTQVTYNTAWHTHTHSWSFTVQAGHNTKVRSLHNVQYITYVGGLLPDRGDIWYSLNPTSLFSPTTPAASVLSFLYPIFLSLSIFYL